MRQATTSAPPAAALDRLRSQMAGRVIALGDSEYEAAGLDGGPRDQLTEFTHPLTGAYYVIPSADRLAAFGLDARAG